MPIAQAVDFQLVIDGVDRTGLVEEDSIEVDLLLGSIGTAEFMLVDMPVSYTPDYGDPVYIIHRGTRLFAGIIWELAFQKIRTSAQGIARKVAVTCVDYHRLLERALVNTHYQNQNVKEIVTDIIEKETPLGPDPDDPSKIHDGVTLGLVQDGLTLVRAAFPDQSVATAIQELAGSSGYASRIDTYKRLHIFERASFRAPFDITDANGRYQSIELSGSLSQYRNKQTLKAGRDITDKRIDRFPGDGKLRTFPLGYEFHHLVVDAPGTAVDGTEAPIVNASTPHQSVLRNGVAQRVGIQGVDADGDDGTAQWFLKVGDRHITQRAGLTLRGNALDNSPLLTGIESTAGVFAGDRVKVVGAGSGGVDFFGAVSSAPGSVGINTILLDQAVATTVDDAEIVIHPGLEQTEELKVVNVGQHPLRMEGQNDEEIQARRNAEGGSGVYQHIEEDQNVDGREFAAQKLERLLLLYGRIPKTVPITLQYPELSPGQLIYLNIADLQVDGDYLIDSIHISSFDLKPKAKFNFTVNALEGDHRENWVEFFKRQAEAGKTFSIRENDPLFISRPFTSALQFGPDVFTDSVNNPSVPLNSYQDDPYTFARIGLITVNGITTHGWVIGQSRIGRPYPDPPADFWPVFPPPVTRRRRPIGQITYAP